MSAKNKSTIFLVFLSNSEVTANDTYLDMRRRLRRADEPKSDLIWWIYFLPAPLNINNDMITTKL
ncbi:MAG: hypothetical protein PVI90_03675 [Desulfobacteraceae bacterium]